MKMAMKLELELELDSSSASASSSSSVLHILRARARAQTIRARRARARARALKIIIELELEPTKNGQARLELDSLPALGETDKDELPQTVLLAQWALMFEAHIHNPNNIQSNESEQRNLRTNGGGLGDEKGREELSEAFGLGVMERLPFSAGICLSYSSHTKVIDAVLTSYRFDLMIYMHVICFFYLFAMVVKAAFSSGVLPYRIVLFRLLRVFSTTTDGLNPQERGVKLIHLLLTCVNHVSAGNLHHADACLRQISRLASVTGDPMQRLSARFASALAARLVKRWPGLYKALNNAVSGEREIHVIDLGSGDPKLWVPYIRAVADNGPDGPPCLKITCVSRNKEAQESLGARLVKEAESLKMSFQFNPVNAGLRELTLDMLQIKTGEALALTSILGLHVLLAEDDRIDAHFGLRRSNEVKECKRMNEFLEMVKSIGPKAMLLVEQESNHNSSRLVDRFVEGLHFYSALFDSVDAAFGGLSRPDRTVLEEMLGKEIENIVAGEGMEREARHERYSMWAVRFTRAGFRPIRLWYEVMEEARRAVENYGSGGFKISSQKGSLVICWHDRPIYAVSAWNCISFC
ncbi:Scarecrow-like protein 3 [Sesamum angolense]|uniref:Scarecrow-like protein 3 n=1 Tax=Sesamum angolense TaxID=2727404 RepID=A0AAE2BPS1_9LAMI|nr:Scarecrow-like protein 3 [Sesamum angolense]